MFTDEQWERIEPLLPSTHELDLFVQLPTPQGHQNRGHFPTTESAVKLLWLTICNIEDRRTRDRAVEKGKSAGQRKAPGRLVE